ncbi:MAG: hypothetical protein ACFE8G_07080 [Candidatus Hermodarchaeota archaeon]
MEFQEFKEKYLKETVPENKIEMISSFSNSINKSDLNFLQHSIKMNQMGKYE